MTHIFYSPHPDDETLGMGGHIARAAAELGPRPMVVYVFDAPPSERMKSLFRGAITCPWHNERHELPDVDLVVARRVEANLAALALGADLMHLGIPEQLVYDDSEAVFDQVREFVQAYADGHPDAVHHFPAGRNDVHVLRGEGHLSHAIVEMAGRALPGLTKIFHRVYAYSQPVGERPGTPIALTAAEMALKNLAMQEYRRWAPDVGRVAYGYHSVPELFDAAAADPTEYLETP